MRSAIFIKGRRGFAVIIVFRNERTQGPQMLRVAQSAGVRYLWTTLRQIIDEVGGAIGPPKLDVHRCSVSRRYNRSCYALNGCAAYTLSARQAH